MRTVTDLRLDREAVVLIAGILCVHPTLISKDGDPCIEGSSGNIHVHSSDYKLFNMFISSTARRWPIIKNVLSKLTVTQDGDTEGCFVFDQASITPEIIPNIRDYLGIRKVTEYTEEYKEELREKMRKMNESTGCRNLGTV